jgi:hypothetical protein
LPKHFTSHKTAILTYLLPSPRASARSPNSSEHSERSTGEADLNLSLSIAYGVPDNACVMGCLTNTIRVFLERLVWLVLLLSATSPVLCGVPKNARGVLGCTSRFRPQDSPCFVFVYYPEYHSALGGHCKFPPFPLGRG